jgi:16S rRNA (uracil1498-N3)-methyltransferase
MRFNAVLPGGEETTVRILSTVDNILIGECLGVPDEMPDKREGREGQKLPSPVPPIALFQSLPRGSKMDLIVRQAAEGGVSTIVPFESEFSATRLRETQSGGVFLGQKLKRWKRIVKEAIQQSGSLRETNVMPPCDFDALLEYWAVIKKKFYRPLGILLHQEPLEKGSFHDYLGTCPDFTALAVGPEGGFSTREVSLLLAAGFRPLLMGNTILRTETAALYGTAAIRIILMESESWMPKPAG